IAGGGFDWVDLETDIADEIPRFGNVRRIVSYHNVQETPAELEAIYARMCKQDADVLKIAVTAQHPTDNLRVLRLLRNAPKPTVAHCMGEIGFPSRILALKYGAPFIYAAFNKERNVAPGMPSFAEATGIYPVERIDAETKVFGVLGDPVAHSLSPLLHNRMFRQLGYNGVYLPFRVARGQFDAFLSAFEEIPLSGYSVTIPHKEAAVRAAKVRDGTVELTRAANTLIREANGFRAANTDYQAALDAITASLPPEEDGSPPTLKGKQVLILGAGGVSRSVAHALKQAGAHLTFTSRTLDRATRLAEDVHGKAIDWKARHNGNYQILVNCTPIGMHPNVDETPIHASFLKPGLVVFDTVYTPENTLLVKEARARGCFVVTGVEMFVRQAALQFEMFTGKQASLEDLREVLRRAISPVTYADAE
ncbi:MAG TPA: shikimate dehydrogenase, partial [Gemmataceae bacterium]